MGVLTGCEERSADGRGRPLRLRPALLLAAVALAACPGGPRDPAPRAPLVVYSGRAEALIGPLFDRFTRETGVEVRVRYGDSAELAATLLEEGARTPADLFISQDAAALGALARRGRLQPLPSSVLDQVPEVFAGAEGRWVGLSGRARAVAYHTDVAPGDLPQSLEEVADARFLGRFGVAPANASFQSHMAVYRAVHGAEALDRLLAGITANQPRIYDKNQAIVEAVTAREIDWGLTNHYYVWRARDERPEARVATFFMPRGEASGFINVSGVGVSSARPEALELVSFLLSPEAQLYFARETFEYPLVPEVPYDPSLPALADLRTPQVDFGEVARALDETLVAIRRNGLLR